MKKLLLTAALAALIPATAIAAGSETSGAASAQGQATLGQNLSVSDVRSLQEALHAGGFYKGSVDGVWGDNTANALRSFQQANNLSATGALNNDTITELGVDLDISASGNATNNSNANSNTSIDSRMDANTRLNTQTRSNNTAGSGTDSSSSNTGASNNTNSGVNLRAGMGAAGNGSSSMSGSAGSASGGSSSTSGGASSGGSN